MPFPKTPTPTPSITPTISLTPSITPTKTPTSTSCPAISPTPTSTIVVTPTTTPTITISPTITITPSITSTPVTPTVTSTMTPTPSLVVYTYAGTTNFYSTSTLACNNKTCGRPWYKSIPSWSLGSIVYDDLGLTTPVNGGNNWIAVATSTGTYCGGGWAAIQIDSSGVIIGFVSC